MLNTSLPAAELADDIIATAAACALADGATFSGERTARPGTKVWVAAVAEAMETTVKDLAPVLNSLRKAGLINLSRCDLVESQDPGTVAASEVEVSLGFTRSTYHLIRL